MESYFWVNVYADSGQHKLGPYITKLDAVIIMNSHVTKVAHTLGIQHIYRVAVSEEVFNDEEWIVIEEVRDAWSVDAPYASGHNSKP